MELLKITIHCRAGKNNELYRACKFITEQTRQMTGCDHCRISSNDNDNFMLLEQEWRQWSDLNTYFNSDHFRALLGAMKMLGQRYEINILKPLNEGGTK